MPALAGYLYRRGRGGYSAYRWPKGSRTDESVRHPLLDDVGVDVVALVDVSGVPLHSTSTSPAGLVDTAIDTDRRVIRDDADDTHHVVDGAVGYEYRPEDGPLATTGGAARPTMVRQTTVRATR